MTGIQDFDLLDLISPDQVEQMLQWEDGDLALPGTPEEVKELMLEVDQFSGPICSPRGPGHSVVFQCPVYSPYYAYLNGIEFCPSYTLLYKHGDGRPDVVYSLELMLALFYGKKRDHTIPNDDWASLTEEMIIDDQNGCDHVVIVQQAVSWCPTDTFRMHGQDVCVDADGVPRINIKAFYNDKSLGNGMFLLPAGVIEMIWYSAFRKGDSGAMWRCPEKIRRLQRGA